MVLLRGLSPNSATVNALRIGAVAPSQRVNRIETPEAAQRAFVAMFAPPPTRPVRPS